MKQDDTRADEGRRAFLKFAAVAPAAVAAGTAGTQAAAAEADEASGTGLRKTAHVKAYLESARF